MRLLPAVFSAIATVVNCNSLGLNVPICDTQDSRIWQKLPKGCTKEAALAGDKCAAGLAMWWATAPTHTDNFRVLASSSPTSVMDVKSYEPEGLMYLHVQAKLQNFKYRGLLLYGEANGKKVGAWELPFEDDQLFHTPPGSCEGKAVMHSGSILKHYEHVFAFRAPPKGTGTVTFKALVKTGPANTGAWHWPNKAGHLTVSEGSTPALPSNSGSCVTKPGKASFLKTCTTYGKTEQGCKSKKARRNCQWVRSTAPTTWLKSNPGQSCTDACKANGGSCDASKLGAAKSPASFLAGPAKEHVCKLPILQSCEGTEPSQENVKQTGDEFCRYRSPSCTKTLSCDKVDARLSLFCPCQGVQQKQATKQAIAGAAPPAPQCGEYCKATGCKWTAKWSCPWSSKKGSKGVAGNNGKDGYTCCCEKNRKQGGCGASGNTEVMADEDAWTEVVEVEEPVCNTIKDPAACKAANCAHHSEDGMEVCDVSSEQEHAMASTSR